MKEENGCENSCQHGCQLSEQVYDVFAPPTSIQDAIFKMHEMGGWAIGDKFKVTTSLDKPTEQGLAWPGEDLEEVEVTIIASYNLDYEDKPYPRVAYWNPHLKQLNTQTHDGRATYTGDLLKTLQTLIPS